MNADTDQMLEPINLSGDVSIFLLYFGRMTMPISLIDLIC
jgi:hypothetical protein